MKKSFIIILVCLSPIQGFGQLNDSLAYYCSQVKTVKDSSESNYPLVHRSSDYTIRILNDTLFIEAIVYALLVSPEISTQLVVSVLSCH